MYLVKSPFSNVHDWLLRLRPIWVILFNTGCVSTGFQSCIWLILVEVGELFDISWVSSMFCIVVQCWVQKGFHNVVLMVSWLT